MSTQYLEAHIQMDVANLLTSASSINTVLEKF
jgi:hypothetical protein